MVTRSYTLSKVAQSGRRAAVFEQAPGASADGTLIDDDKRIMRHCTYSIAAGPVCWASSLLVRQYVYLALYQKSIEIASDILWDVRELPKTTCSGILA